jgi:hypothetical protein
MGILDSKVILTLHKAALAASLASSREALLVRIDRRFVHGLGRASSPRDQLLVDLNELNNAGELDDGTVPLAQWLENAEHLVGARREASVFREALAHIDELMSEDDEEDDDEDEDDEEDEDDDEYEDDEEDEDEDDDDD